jgi:hypothetical protein
MGLYTMVNHQSPSGADVSERVELHIYPNSKLWDFMAYSRVSFTFSRLSIIFGACGKFPENLCVKFLDFNI